MSMPGLKLNETDEEFFGALGSRSNLANLFGVNQQKEDDNQSLKYKPTKPMQVPADGGGNEPAAQAWSVQVAKVVTAFKLIKNENISQGRVGLALLKNTQNDFKIIVYRTKTNVLGTITLHPEARLILKSSYLQFHDDSQQFWSIFLETSDEKSFIDHIPPDILSTIDESKQERLYSEETPVEPIITDTEPTNKAKLLSRMAKMGQPLPKMATVQTTTDMSDSSDTEMIKMPPKPCIVPRKISKQLVPVGNALQSTSLIAYAPQVQENQYMNMLLTENRTQNTELRMNLSKLETKIERVLDKMDSLGSSESAQAKGKDKDDEIVGLEEKILELRKENRSLRQSIREMEAKKANPERKEPKLRVEMFSAFEDVVQELGVHLTDCVDLEDVTMELFDKSRSKLNELQNECKRRDSELEESRKNLQRLKATNLDLEKMVKDFEGCKSNAEDLSKENEELIRKLDRVKLDSNNELKGVVKEIMNKLYGSIATSLESTSDPLTNETVLRICGSAIRKETINAIQGNTD